MGNYRGSESFGGATYQLDRPPAFIPWPVSVVLLTLKDERPANEHDLDWTRQASNFSKTSGQPAEVRADFDRALRSGLSAHPGIHLISPQAFLQSKKADLVISGRILRCDADRGANGFWATTARFKATCTIEILLRNGEGRALAGTPVQVSGEGRRTIDQQYVDEIPPGLVAASVEDAIREASQAFLRSQALNDALPLVSHR